MRDQAEAGRKNPLFNIKNALIKNNSVLTLHKITAELIKTKLLLLHAQNQHHCNHFRQIDLTVAETLFSEIQSSQKFSPV